MRFHTLEAHPINAVKGELLPIGTMPDGPAKLAILSLLEHPPGVVTKPTYAFPEEKFGGTSITLVGQPVDPKSISSYPIEQLPFGNSNDGNDVEHNGFSIWQAGDRHMRSYIVNHPFLNGGLNDEYGNHFNSFTTKGNNYSNPGVMQTSTAAKGFIAFGLQEGHVIRRVMRASDALRRLKIGTEYIIGMSEPTQVPYPDPLKQTDEVNMLGRNEYKQRIIMDCWSGMDEDDRTFEKLTALQAAIADTAYYVSFRGMDSPYRLDDVLRDPKVSEIVRASISDGAETISEDEYLRTHIVPKVADNLVRMHIAGLAHRFPTSGNITAHGSLIDLDSVHGVPLNLGDDPIKDSDIVNDIMYVAESLPMRFYSVENSKNERSSLAGEFTRRYLSAYSEQADAESISIDDIISGLKSYANWRRAEAGSTVLSDMVAWAAAPFETSQTENVDKAGKIAGDFIKQRTSEIRERAVTLIEENIFMFADDIVTDLTNEFADELQSGEVASALQYMKDNFTTIDSVIAEFIEEACFDLWAEMVARSKTQGNDDKEGNENILDENAIYTIHVSDLISGIDEGHWARVLKAATEFFDEASSHKNILYGNPYPAFLSQKGNLIYTGSVPYGQLRDILLDESNKIRKIQNDEFQKERLGHTYRVGQDKKVLQCLTFDEDDDGSEAYSYEAETESDVLQIASSTTGLILFLVEEEDGSIVHEVYACDPSTIDEVALSSAESFEAARINPKKEQGTLFDGDRYKVRSRIWHGIYNDAR